MAENTEKTSKFAVIKTGGKQYTVSTGDSIKIEKLPGEHKVGDTLTFSEVLLVDDGSTANVGLPTVSGASVTAKVAKIGRGQTIEVIHYKQKSRYFKRYGHRQPYFEVKIESIK